MPLAAALTPGGRGAPPAGRRPPIAAFDGAGTDSVTSARAPRPERDRAAEHKGHGAVADGPADLWVPFLVLALSAGGFGLIVLARNALP
jgi:hypothetical protein